MELSLIFRWRASQGITNPSMWDCPQDFDRELSEITAEVQRGLTENVTKQRKVLLKSLKGVAKPSMGLSYSQQLVVEDWL